MGGAPATALSTNTGRKRCGGWMKNKRRLRNSSTDCATRAIRRSSISFWPSATARLTLVVRSKESNKFAQLEAKKGGGFTQASLDFLLKRVGIRLGQSPLILSFSPPGRRNAA